MGKINKRTLQKVKNNIKAIYEDTQIEKEAVIFRKRLGFLADFFQTAAIQAKDEFDKKGIEVFILEFFAQLNEVFTKNEYANDIVEYRSSIIKEFKKIIKNIEPEYKDKDGKPILYAEKIKWDKGYPGNFSELSYIRSYIWYLLSGGMSEICIKLKRNPRAWCLYIFYKFFDIPIENALKHAEETICAYLPKMNIPNNLTIQINELTTIEDIKAIWPQVKAFQKSYGKNFKQVKRKYATYERGARAYELQKQGFTYMEIHRKLRDEGFPSPGYDAMGDILNYHKKFIGETN